MRIILTLVMSLCMMSSILCQGDLLKTRQKLLSFKQAKITPGVGIEYGTGSLYQYEGSLPLESQIIDPFFATGSLLFDINAPKSRLSFAFGGEWNYFNFTYSAFENQTFFFNDITAQYLRFPALIKFSLGNKFSFINMIFYGGASYDIPFMYRDSNTLTYNITHMDRKILQSTYSGFAGIAFQFNFRGKARQDYYVPLIETGGDATYVKVVLPRLWITLKATRSYQSYYNRKYNKSIFENVDNNELQLQDLRYTFGFMFFLGSNKKHAIE